MDTSRKPQIVQQTKVGGLLGDRYTHWREMELAYNYTNYQQAGQLRGG